VLFLYKKTAARSSGYKEGVLQVSASRQLCNLASETKQPIWGWFDGYPSFEILMTGVVSLLLA